MNMIHVFLLKMKTKMKKHDGESNDKDDCVLKRCFQIKMEYPLSCTII